jgi:hypothetical protein
MTASAEKPAAAEARHQVAKMSFNEAEEDSAAAVARRGKASNGIAGKKGGSPDQKRSH